VTIDLWKWLKRITGRNAYGGNSGRSAGSGGRMGGSVARRKRTLTLISVASCLCNRA
jgi:hypothetical protein